MLNVYRTLKNYVNGVICLDLDLDNEVVTCVINGKYLEIQIYNEMFYMVTVMDDETGDELLVTYVDLNGVYRLAKSL
jgi:hypothetical protein